MVGGRHAAVDGLAALHALGPGRRAVGSAGGTCSARCRLVTPPRITARSPEAKPLSGRLAARRSGLSAGRSCGLSDAGRATRAIGGCRAASHRGARPSRASDRPASSRQTTGRRRNASRTDTGGRKACADSGARAELRTAGDQAVGNAGTEDGETEQRQRRKD